MMKITILCVGKIKEKFYAQAIEEYSKRLKAYAKLEIIEVTDEKTPDGASQTETEQIKAKEAARMAKHLDSGAYKIALTIDGTNPSSEGLSAMLDQCMVRGYSGFIFVIGGSLGLAQSVVDRCDYRLSFSKMTFPHQLMRVILLEQVYRAFKIRANEPYHK
jgi:23S rRNA (pseudouridine1915-N3)-methyltransferase